MKRRRAAGGILVVLLFFILSFAYFGKELLHGLIPFEFDMYARFYPLLGVVKEQYLAGRLPFWNPYMFSGMPLLATSEPATLYPLSILPAMFLPLHVAVNLDIVVHHALAGLFTFLYARKMGLDAFSSFISGVLFSFMGYLMYQNHLLSILRTATWFPLVLYFFEDIRTGGRVKSGVAAGLVIALQFLPGHPQICFYTYSVLLFFVAFHCLHLESGKRLRFLGLSVGAMGIGMAIVSPQLYALYELYSFGVRPGLNYAAFSGHALPVKEVSGLIFPSAVGRSQAYMGVMPFLLAVIAVLFARKENVHVKFWSGIAVLSLALAVGPAIRPLNELMFHVPLYSSFRAASKHVFEFDFCLALLSGFGISFLLSQPGGKRGLLILTSLLVSVFCLSLAVEFFSGTPVFSLAKARFPMLLMLLCLFILALIIRSGRYQTFRYVVIGVVLAEILLFKGGNWIEASSLDGHHAELFNRVSDLHSRTAFFADNDFATMGMLRGVRLVGGYDPLVPRDYNALLQLQGVGAWSAEWPRLVENNRLLSMLNARYLVLPVGMKLPKEDDRYRLLATAPDYLLYENTLCMPVAYSVGQVVGIEGAGQTREAFLRSFINPRECAVVSGKDLAEIATGYFSHGDVTVRKYLPDQVLLKTEFKGKGFVVLADQFYPGWKASIDGRPTKIYRTNGALRGVVVPPGVHEISFAYRPAIIYALFAFSGSVLAAVCILLFRSRAGRDGADG